MSKRHIPAAPTRLWVVVDGSRHGRPVIYRGSLHECLRRSEPTSRVVPA